MRAPVYALRYAICQILLAQQLEQTRMAAVITGFGRGRIDRHLWQVVGQEIRNTGSVEHHFLFGSHGSVGHDDSQR